MNSSTPSLNRIDPRSSASLRDIHRLISECHVVLKADPSCLHTRAVRGHACMKAKLWDQAIQDFSEILRCRTDDVHGRFSRGMALFNSGRVDDAHRDFSRVLELNPNHVMARYARAGCYNSEGEFNQAIQEYVLALQHDEKENAGGFRVEKRRLRMHESAEQLIRKTMGACATARLSSSSLPPVSSLSGDSGVSLHGQKSVATYPLTPQQEHRVLQPDNVQVRSISVPGKRPRKVVQVRVNLSEFATPAPQKLTEPPMIPELVEAPRKRASDLVASADVPVAYHLGRPSRGQPDNISILAQQQPQQQTHAPRVAAVRVVSKTVRRVTVAL